eukprot:gb/GFBE01083506.1/.p1 GENE.gb/GFBE01083506.1/~~gb/GFBE01083506.1/.p1  ORF type:complete len:602 (+),score=187.52 gb/GFBE01083506.1/:1-1806(+)
MAQKTKAIAPPEDEVPCKVLKRSVSELSRDSEACLEDKSVDKVSSSLQTLATSDDLAAAAGTVENAASVADNTPEPQAASDIPDERIQTEVQTLLVGADLTAMTVGELRSRTEANMGLEAGTLAARKTQRRRFCALVHHEVLKKSRRTSECEKIVKELLQLEEYPAAARQMLIESLPHAMAATASTAPAMPAALHQHQVQLLSIARDALLENQQLLETAERQLEVELRQAEVAIVSQDAVVAAAAEAAAAARAVCERAEAALKDTESEVQEMEKELESTRARAASVLKESEHLRTERERIGAVRTGPVETLAVGSWKSEEEWWEAFAAVQQHLLDTGAESSLLDAATVSLKKPPQDRSDFDRMAVGGVTGLLADQLGKADEAISQRGRLEMEAEAAILSSSAMLDATRSRAARQSEVVARERGSQESTAAASAGAVAAVPELRAAEAERREQRVATAEKLRSLGEALSLLQSWISGSSVPASLGAEAAASAQATEEAAAGAAAEADAPVLPVQEQTAPAQEATDEPMPAQEEQAPAAEEPVQEAQAEQVQEEEAKDESVLQQSPAPKSLESKIDMAEAEAMLYAVGSPRRVPTPMKGRVSI